MDDTGRLSIRYDQSGSNFYDEATRRQYLSQVSLLKGKKNIRIQLDKSAFSALGHTHKSSPYRSKESTNAGLDQMIHKAREEDQARRLKDILWQIKHHKRIHPHDGSPLGESRRDLIDCTLDTQAHSFGTLPEITLFEQIQRRLMRNASSKK